MRKTLLFLIILLITTHVFAFRINRPPELSLPLTPDQINELNGFLDRIWNLTNGEFNLDIVTTTKSNADNGDFWILQTGVISQIQWRANDTTYTISP